MKNSIVFSLIIVLALFASCKKDQPKTPNYFEDLNSSHVIKTSCAFASVYITITDTSCIYLHLDDDELDIDTTGTILGVADLIDWNSVCYYAWIAHEDSVAPVFCDDVLPWNMSSYQKWNITEGAIIASVSKSAEDRGSSEMYEISIHLKDAVFDRTEMSTVNIPSIIVKDVPVGWYPG